MIGTGYSPGERYEIIEYMKVHLDDPPLSGLYLEAFEGIVASVMASLPQEGNEAAVATIWPLGQACNLEEYLGNHSSDDGLSESLAANIATIEARLDAYFSLPDAYECGGKTRYQRGGEDYEG